MASSTPPQPREAWRLLFRQAYDDYNAWVREHVGYGRSYNDFLEEWFANSDAVAVLPADPPRGFLDLKDGPLAGERRSVSGFGSHVAFSRAGVQYQYHADGTFDRINGPLPADPPPAALAPHVPSYPPDLEVFVQVVNDRNAMEARVARLTAALRDAVSTWTDTMTYAEHCRRKASAEAVLAAVPAVPEKDAP